jgi:hypothetical protein
MVTAPRCACGVPSGTLHVHVRWHVTRRTWHVARRTSHVARRTSHVARRTLSKQMDVLGPKMEEAVRKAEGEMRALLQRTIADGRAEAVK